MSLPTITLHQPYASLVVAGVKTIETRTGPPAGDMRPDGVRPEPGFAINRGDRIGIHAGKSWPVPASDPVWAAAAERGVSWDVRMHNTPSYGDARTGTTAPPLGALIGTAVVADALPIVSNDDKDVWHTTHCIVVDHRLTLWHPADWDGCMDISDQRPFGIWTPGRWAWLLDDINPTSARCPWCLGAVADHTWPTSTCPVCHAAGYCPPVPAKGKQGVWRWEL